MAKSKAKPILPNAPSKTGNKSGGNRGNLAPKPKSGKK